MTLSFVNHSFHRDIWARTAEESLLNTHIPNMMVNEILQYAWITLVIVTFKLLHLSQELLLIIFTIYFMF